MESLGTGQYLLRFTGLGRIGDNALVSGLSTQVATLGTSPGSCHTTGWGPQDYRDFYTVAQTRVACYDPSGKPADIPFGVALVRRP